MYISLKDGRPKMLYTVQDTIPRCTCTHWPLRTLSCTLLFVPSHIPLLAHITLSHTTPHTVTLSHTTPHTVTLSPTTPHTPSHSHIPPLTHCHSLTYHSSHIITLSHTTPHTPSHSHATSHTITLTHRHTHIPLLTPSLISAMLDILDWMFWDIHSHTCNHPHTLTLSHPHSLDQRV